MKESGLRKSIEHPESAIARTIPNDAASVDATLTPLRSAPPRSAPPLARRGQCAGNNYVAGRLTVGDESRTEEDRTVRPISKLGTPSVPEVVSVFVWCALGLASGERRSHGYAAGTASNREQHAVQRLFPSIHIRNRYYV